MRNSEQSIFLREISTLISAGIPPAEAIGKLSADSKIDWSTTVSELKKGRSFHHALFKSGKITPFEQEIIRVSESSGRLSEGLRSIADSSEARQLRRKKAKSKLMMPFGVLFIAIFSGAVIEAVKYPEASLAGIIFTVLAYLFIAIMITKWLLAQINKDAASLLRTLFPLRNRKWYKQLFQQVVFGALYWQIKSGIDFKTGFQRTSNLIPQKILKSKLLKASRLCGQGKSVNQSIQAADLPLTNEFVTVLTTGEQSGEWNSALERFLTYQQEELNDTTDLVISWLPRVYYFFVVLVALSVIF